MKQRRIAFRTDAFAVMGTGHFMRCLTLAKALLQRQCKVVFVVRFLPETMVASLEEQSITCLRLPTLPVPGNTDASTWLGCDAMLDAEQTRACLELEGLQDWLIVDHYAIDGQWQRVLRNVTRQMLVIDDLADRQHDCEALLDQNLVAAMNQRYRGKVPEKARLLLGPDYALLRDEFHLCRSQQRRLREGIQRVLVFLGGGDPDNLTGAVLQALEAMAMQQSWQMDVVVSGLNPHRTWIEEYCLLHDALAFHCDIDYMAELMQSADLAIGAAGASSWERMVLGLPAVVMEVADNQHGIAEALHEKQCVINLGIVDRNAIRAGSTASFSRDLQNAVSQAQLALEQMSKNCYTLVDGLGVSRVIETLLGESLL